jgi:hypothetical protein
VKCPRLGTKWSESLCNCILVLAKILKIGSNLPVSFAGRNSVSDVRLGGLVVCLLIAVRNSRHGPGEGNVNKVVLERKR